MLVRVAGDESGGAMTRLLEAKRRIDMLIHALGLSRSKESYRNHYCADEANADCLALEERGLFVRTHNNVPTGGLITYQVTPLGRLVVMLVGEAIMSPLRTFVERVGTDDSRACAVLGSMGVIDLYDDRGACTKAWRLRWL